MQPFQFDPHAIFLTSFLALIPTTFAVTRCLNPHPQMYGLQHPPPPDDCLAILSQIPLLHVARDADQHHHSPNFPFFPRSYFIHGQCQVRISYSTEPPPSLDLPGTAAGFRTVWASQQQTPDIPLSAATVSEIWRAARSSIQEVTEECLTRNGAGFEWHFLNDAPEFGYPYPWLLVLIMGHDMHGWAQQTIGRERALLNGIDHNANARLDRNKYKMTFWEVD